MLFDICKQRGLDKVMLTVFKGTLYLNSSVPRNLKSYGPSKDNETAILFYENMGCVPSLPRLFPKPSLRRNAFNEDSYWTLLRLGMAPRFPSMTETVNGKTKGEGM